MIGAYNVLINITAQCEKGDIKNNTDETEFLKTDIARTKIKYVLLQPKSKIAFIMKLIDNYI